MKNYRPDTQALRQAMKMFEQKYQIIRTKVHQYDDMGRIDNVENCEYIKGSIQVDDNSLDVNTEGFGEWEKTSYTLTIVYPEHVDLGDIIITEEYGRLKVSSQSSGTSLFGVSSYTLVRTGTINPIQNAEDYL